MGFGQVIVRYGRAEVVYVVETYIARQPLQGQGQAVIGTALDSREHIVPVVLAILIDILILVLDIKEPQCIGAKEKKVDELHEQEFLPSEEISQYSIKQHKRYIADRDALLYFFKPILTQESKAVIKDHIDEAADSKEIEWAAVDPVAHLAPGSEGVILLSGQALYIAHITILQLPVVSVVEVVRFGPVLIGDHCKSAGDCADDVIGQLAAGE